MILTLLKNTLFISALSAIIFAGHIFAQETEPATKKVNFGYSRNPSTKSKTSEEKTDNPNTENSADIAKNNASESRSAANKTLEVAKLASRAALPPTETYKVGIGDVLYISLQNAPAKDSTYFTILNDGTIDYPLAGEMVSVSGLTTEEIEDILREKIKLYENPQVAVKIREFSSQTINVLGLVENAGRKSLQRDAVPLFVIKAEAIVQPRANQVIIRRANGVIETLILNDLKTDEVLISNGDIVEFADSGETVTKNTPQFFYIGGEISSVGQKDFYKGMTLTQALLASGGVKNSKVKKIIVRRKNSEGLLVSTEYNLKEIKEGKSPDPEIQAGDTIEVDD